MFALVALIAMPFVILSALLLVAEAFGKKKQWN